MPNDSEAAGTSGLHILKSSTRGCDTSESKYLWGYSRNQNHKKYSIVNNWHVWGFWFSYFLFYFVGSLPMCHVFFFFFLFTSCLCLFSCLLPCSPVFHLLISSCVFKSFFVPVLVWLRLLLACPLCSSFCSLWLSGLYLFLISFLDSR